MPFGISKNASAFATICTVKSSVSSYAKQPPNFQTVRKNPSTDRLRHGQLMQVEEPDSGLREHGMVEPTPFTAREDVAV
jgi:hypothetical protein